ncbi:MAG: cytochrome ubiquinol oxidase subunit I, partial [Bacilli bacterium]
VFGTPLAIEALGAFFIEATFMGIWIFCRNRNFSPKLRAFSMVMVAIGVNFASVWIITANGFMQNPVGYISQGDRVIITNLQEVLLNPYAWYMIAHTIVSAYVVGAFFVIGIAGFHLYRKSQTEFFMKAMKYALVFGAIFVSVTPLIGHQYGTYVAKVQPIKAAAMEAVWETTDDLGFSIIQIPQVNKEENIEFLTIPKLGTFLYTNSFDGEVIGLKSVPKEERPNVGLVFYSFRVMVGLGGVFIVFMWTCVVLYYRRRLAQSALLKWFPALIPLPYVAIMCGWVVAEAGRQPWTVVGLLRTSHSMSSVSASQVLFSMSTTLFFYGVLFAVNSYLMIKWARRGPAIEDADTKRGEMEYVS